MDLTVFLRSATVEWYAETAQAPNRHRGETSVLDLTPNATNVIKDLTTQPDIPQGSGLRIAPAPDGSGELQLSLQAEPVPGDQVIDTEGARVFLEPATADLLADQTLDAQVSDAGAGFYLTAQH